MTLSLLQRKEYELKLINLGLKPLTGVNAAVQARQEIERAIAARVIESAIAQGCTIDVNDGEETVLKRGNDLKTVLNAMFETDDEWLIIRMNGHKIGWVRLIYGNDGWDVVNDYTTNLEPIMTEANALIDSYSE